MRQDSTRSAVEDALKGYDEANGVISFCGEAQCLGEYYITPVIQIPESTFIKFPALANKPKGNRQQGYGYRSLIHAAIFTVLYEVSERLQSPEPGRNTYKAMRSPEEIIQIAAKGFYVHPGYQLRSNTMGMVF